MRRYWENRAENVRHFLRSRMTKPTYPRAVHAVLKEAGFARETRVRWTRSRDLSRDIVELQTSVSRNEVTLNVCLYEDEIDQTLRRLLFPAGLNYEAYPVNERLPMLMTGYDRWWSRSDPGTAEAMAAALRSHGLPFLDGLHEPMAFIGWLEPKFAKWRSPIGVMYGALMLHRLGRTAEGCALLENPNRHVKARADILRAHIGCSDGAGG